MLISAVVTGKKKCWRNENLKRTRAGLSVARYIVIDLLVYRQRKVLPRRPAITLAYRALLRAFLDWISLALLARLHLSHSRTRCENFH